ncbi:MAG: cysteine synthase, partial [Acidobacteria bacterium]
FWTDQFNNPDNRAGYAPMAREVLEELDGKLDEFVMGVGTGGCFSGNAEVYKREVPGVRCVAIEPANSRALSGQGPYGGHRLEGMGAGFVPEEGVFGGITSGANVWVALQRAKQLGPGHRVVTVICDSGLKYLQGELYRQA